MANDCTSVVLESEDFNEVAFLEKLLRSKGIAYQSVRLRTPQGGLLPAKQVLVGEADRAVALELATDIAARRKRLREMAPKKKEWEIPIPEHGTIDIHFGGF